MAGEPEKALFIAPPQSISACMAVMNSQLTRYYLEAIHDAPTARSMYLFICAWLFAQIGQFGVYSLL